MGSLIRGNCCAGCRFSGLQQFWGNLGGFAILGYLRVLLRWHCIIELTTELKKFLFELEWTPDSYLRHSKFVGLREDKEAREVVRER